MNFKKNLKDLMEYKNLVIKEVAAKSGVSESAIKSYLSERGTEPTVSKAMKIAEALGVSVEYLVSGQDVCHKTQISPAILGLEEKLACLNYDDFHAIEQIVESLSRKM